MTDFTLIKGIEIEKITNVRYANFFYEKCGVYQINPIIIREKHFCIKESTFYNCHCLLMSMHEMENTRPFHWWSEKEDQLILKHVLAPVLEKGLMLIGCTINVDSWKGPGEEFKESCVLKFRFI